jgi:Flp pilus assembly protein TadG
MHQEEGAAAVEFALIVTLLIVILFGITEFGVAFSKKEVYVSAAREGARYAATRCSDNPPCDNTKIAARVTTAATGYSITPGSPAADKACDNSTIGTQVTVSWLQNFTIHVPLLPWTINKDVLIKGVFRCE